MPYLPQFACSDRPVTEDAPGSFQVPWEMPASPAYRFSLIAERRLKTFQRDVYVRAWRAITNLLESERAGRPRVPYDNPFIMGWEFHDVFIHEYCAITIIYSFIGEFLSIDYIDPEVPPSGGSSPRSGLCYSLIQSHFLLATSSVRVAAMDRKNLAYPEVQAGFLGCFAIGQVAEAPVSDTTPSTTAKLTVVDGNHRYTAMSVLAVNTHPGGFAVAPSTPASPATICWSIDGGRLGVALPLTGEVCLGAAFAAGLVGAFARHCGIGTVCLDSPGTGPATYDAGAGMPATGKVCLSGSAAGLVGAFADHCDTLIGAYLGSAWSYCDDRHIVTIGPNGSGKSKRLLVPNLIQLSGWSILVIDPKGELAAMTAAARERAWGEIVILDPFHELPDTLRRTGAGEAEIARRTSHGFNPVAALNPNPTNVNFPDDAKGIGGTICLDSLAMVVPGTGPVTYDAGAGMPAIGKVCLGSSAPIFPCLDEVGDKLALFNDRVGVDLAKPDWGAVIPGSGIDRKRIH